MMARVHLLLRLLSALGGIALGVWLSLPVEVPVSRGDTWASLGARCGLSAQEVRRANPGLRLQPGEAVRLPIPRWRCYLRAWGVERAFAGILATPTPAPARKIPAAVRTAAPTPDPRAAFRAAFEEINRMRAEAGLPPLAWDDGLAALAQARAEDMVRRRYFAHEDPETGRPALEGKLSKYTDGVAYLGGWTGITLEKAVVDAPPSWRSSPRHHAVLTDPEMRRGGLGAACGLWDSRKVCIVVGVVDR